MHELLLLSGLLVSPLLAVGGAALLRIPLARVDRLPWRWLVAAVVGGLLGVQLIVALTPEPILHIGFLGVDTFDLGIRVPVTEEAIKAIPLVLLCVMGALRDEVDGLAYGALVGLGFAIAENHRYFMIAPDEDILVMLYATRTFLSTSGHALTTAMVGLGLGTLVARRRPSSVLVVLAGFVAASAVHGFYNVYLPHWSDPWFLAYAVAQFAVCAVLVAWTYRRARKLTTVTQSTDHGQRAVDSGEAG